MLFAKAILTFTGFVGGFASVGAYYYFAKKKLHEADMNSFTFLYQDTQGDDKEANAKWQKMIPVYSPALIELNKGNPVPTTEMLIGWDHPKWVVTEKEQRYAGGIAVDSKVSNPSDPKWNIQNDQVKIKKIEGGKILRLDVNIGKPEGAVYNIAWWFLYKRYLALYKQKMIELNEPFVPVIAAKENNKGFLFLPAPECIKNYKISKFSEPQLNFAGESHRNLLSKKTSVEKSPASSPVKQEKVPEVVKAPESLAKIEAKPTAVPTQTAPVTAPKNPEPPKAQVSTQAPKQ